MFAFDYHLLLPTCAINIRSGQQVPIARSFNGKRLISNRPILIYTCIKIPRSIYGPQYETLGNNYRVCGVYFPESRAEVYCARLNFNIS